MSTTNERILLLIGSPKGLEGSNSGRLGSRVVDGLKERGWSSESIHLHQAVRSEEAMEQLLAAIRQADVVLLAAPLYVDSLPAPVIRAFERIAAERKPEDIERVARFASILNCGFVEPQQNRTCQRMLKRFADCAGFEWVYGVSLGATGRTTKRVCRALDILVEALDLELLVSEEAGQLTDKPVLPPWLYILGGNMMWKQWADRNGVKDRLRARPYAANGN